MKISSDIRPASSQNRVQILPWHVPLLFLLREGFQKFIFVIMFLITHATVHLLYCLYSGMNIKTYKRKAMKNLKELSLLIICLTITASADAQFRKTVYGNGKVVSEERTPVQASGVRVSTGIDVYLTQGDKLNLVVEADENLHDYIITEVKNGILDIYTDANIRKAEMKRVYVTLRTINSVSTSSAGDIIGESPVETDDLRISASSAGDIKLEVYANNIDANISSSGDVTLTGEAGFMEADLSSAGDLNAYNLKVKDADVSVSSAGGADIFVTEKLIARASSAGAINYKGDPEKVDAHSSSAGGIHRR